MNLTERQMTEVRKIKRSKYLNKSFNNSNHRRLLELSRKCAKSLRERGSKDPDFKRELVCCKQIYINT